MRIILLAIILTISVLSNAQQKTTYYYRHTMVMGDNALNEMVALFNKRIQDDSPQKDSSKASLSPQQIAQLNEMHQELSDQPFTMQEVYSIEKEEVFLIQDASNVLKFNFEKGIYTKGYKFVDKGKEVTSFDPTEQELTKVVTTIKRTDSLKSINDYECVLFLLTIQYEQEPNDALAKENIMIWATRSLLPALPVQAVLMLKKPVKEMEHYTPVMMTTSSPNFSDSKDVMILEKVN
jgi:hypothetical protein